MWKMEHRKLEHVKQKQWENVKQKNQTHRVYNKTQVYSGGHPQDSSGGPTAWEVAAAETK